MKLNISNIINKHAKEKCIVVAHGPSATPYLERLPELKNNYKIIACNEWFHFHTIPPNYLILANTMFTVQENLTRFNNDNIPIIYSDSIDLTDREFIEKNLKCDYLPYDSRHFNSHGCGCGRCCNHIIKDRLTVQEELEKYSGYSPHYGTGDTVAFHMIAFSILMGFSEIYIAGMDLNYQLGYAKNTVNMKADSAVHNFHYEFRERLVESINILNESAKKIGTKIINLNRKSWFGILESGSI